MTRTTSIATYDQIIREGLLGKLQLEVYGLLFVHGPMTANELMRVAKEDRAILNHQRLESLGRRLSELRNNGTVIEKGTKICSVSKRKCIIWEATNKLPVRTVKLKKIKCEYCKGTGKI